MEKDKKTPFDQKCEWYMKALIDLEKIIDKEIRMGLPFEFMSKEDFQERRDDAVDKLVKLFDLHHNAREYHNKIRSLVEAKTSLAQVIKDKDMEKVTELECDIIRMYWHGVETVEEGREKDLEYGCILSNKKRNWRFVKKFQGKFVLQDLLEWRPFFLKDEVFEVFENLDNLKILGLPTTLSRVLEAGMLRIDSIFQNKNDRKNKYLEYTLFVLSKWNFKDENGKELTLEDQPDETKIAIAKLLIS